ncbi:MAG: DUF4147 domain-containing protein [bacterium]|nr:DUF4147 domain-containing protein [bacterium]
MTSSQLCTEAQSIWRAGVEAVKPQRLFQDKIAVSAQQIEIGSSRVDLSGTGRVIVVGAGKASAAMAIALERYVLYPLKEVIPNLQWSGWINCPEGSFDPAEAGTQIELFEARPPGLNEPTEKAVLGTQKILQLLSSCQPNDLVICLLSGGGSALLSSPIDGLTLGDKQNVARLVAAAGGNIVQLNTVRRALSNVKAGGLARACRASKMLTLVISDVLGDSLETIASGPTYLDSPAEPAEAIRVLETLSLADRPELQNVLRRLRIQERQLGPAECSVEHVILGSNVDAVRAAELRALELGYTCQTSTADYAEGDVLELADSLSQGLLADLRCTQDIQRSTPKCIISGGEPTVSLPAHPGRGGRNQLLALAIMKRLQDAGWPSANLRELAFVSGGTDGEDGPTDAAGACFDSSLAQQADALGLNPDAFITSADPYNFFQPVGGLIQIGATGTNVCDLRVAVIR